MTTFAPLLLLAGCSALAPRAALPPLTPAETHAVIADCTALLSTQFAPARTVLYFPATMQELEQGLSQALRDRGFAIAAQPSDTAQALAYRITALDERTLLVRLEVSDEWGANRLYRRTPDRKALLADSAFAVRTNDANPPTTLRPWQPPEPFTARPAALVTPVPAPIPATVAENPPAKPAQSLPDQSAKSPPQAEPSPSPDRLVGPVSPFPRVPMPIELVTELPGALRPDAAGVIVVPKEPEPPELSEPNPFVVRYRPKTVFREVPVEITGIVAGPRPTAIVNGRIVNPGDAFDTFHIEAIAREAVFFRKPPFLLRVPVARDRAGFIIRLPE